MLSVLVEYIPGNETFCAVNVSWRYSRDRVRTRMHRDTTRRDEYVDTRSGPRPSGDGVSSAVPPAFEPPQAAAADLGASSAEPHAMAAEQDGRASKRARHGDHLVPCAWCQEECEHSSMARCGRCPKESAPVYCSVECLRHARPAHLPNCGGTSLREKLQAQAGG